jgi:hypothetical protein
MKSFDVGIIIARYLPIFVVCSWVLSGSAKIFSPEVYCNTPGMILIRYL